MTDHQPTVAVAFIGCKVNQSEAEGWTAELRTAGFRVVPLEQLADIYLINSCTVTHKADRDVRKLILKLGRIAPQASIVVTGCLVDVNPESVQSLPGVVRLVTRSDKARMVDILSEMTSSSKQPRTDLPISHNYWPPAPDPESTRGRAFLKVQDGCEANCAYCIVPRARGKPRSRPVADVLATVRACEDSGFEEIVLTGVHLGRYNHELSKQAGLLELLQGLLAGTSRARFRLSSIEPNELSFDLLSLVAASPRICPHFHIPVQSGSAAILKAMGRPYTPEAVDNLVETISSTMENVAIGTDLLVGFPGETDQDFEQTLAMVQRLPFTHTHVFSYSPRSGTRAAAFERQITHQVIQERTKALKQIGALKLAAYKLEQVGKTLHPVVLETSAESYCSGLTENYVRASFVAPRCSKREIVAVRITHAIQDQLIAEIAP